MTLGYLGPEGTFSQQAARDHDAGVRHIPYSNIPSVMQAAEAGQVQEAVVPIENRLEGPVTATTDLLIHHSPVVIRRELVVPLGALATCRINMVRIESRPDGRSLGRYVFLVDLEEHRTDPAVADALEEMRASASMFKILGSYPRAAAPGASAAAGPGRRADRLT